MKKGLIALVCVATLALAPGCKRDRESMKRGAKKADKSVKKTRSSVEKHSKNMYSKSNRKVNDVRRGARNIKTRHMSKAVGY